MHNMQFLLLKGFRSNNNKTQTVMTFRHKVGIIVVGVFRAPLLMKMDQKCIILCVDTERRMSGMFRAGVKSRVFAHLSSMVAAVLKIFTEKKLVTLQYTGFLHQKTTHYL